VAVAADALAQIVAGNSLGAMGAASSPALAELARIYAEAYTAGYASVMRAVALVCVLTAGLVWLGLRPTDEARTGPIVDKREQPTSA
jgi:hypothetical protein